MPESRSGRLTRTIVVVDVASFSHPSRTSLDGMAVRPALYEVLKTAFAESDVDFGSVPVEDRSDGALILPPRETARILAERLPVQLVVALRRHNSVRVPQARFKLRVGLTTGEVRHDGTAWTGSAIDLAFRILEAPRAKRALAQSGGSVVLVASERFFTDVIEHDPSLVPDSYQQFPVTVKAYTVVAYMRLLGEPHRLSPAPNPPPDLLEVIPAAEFDALRDQLAGREIPWLPTLMSQALGPAIPLPRLENVHDPWRALDVLAEFNAGPDGIPPAIRFLQLLADEMGGDQGAKVREWVRLQARRMRIDQLLARERVNPHEAPELRPPLSQARVRLCSGEDVRIGEPMVVDFAFVRSELASADSGQPDAEHRVPLRVLLFAADASVRPMTSVVDLEPDRTSRPVRFEVVPDKKGRLRLRFRVYLARDGQLLQEVHADLMVVGA